MITRTNTKVLILANWLMIAMSDPATHIAKVLRRAERGDADSAGSTLRTIMVVAVVAAVVGVIGLAVRTAGSDAAACIGNRGAGC